MNIDMDSFAFEVKMHPYNIKYLKLFFSRVIDIKCLEQRDVEVLVEATRHKNLNIKILLNRDFELLKRFLEHLGVDAFVELDGVWYAVDFKTRKFEVWRQYRDDVFIEIISMDRFKELGWVFNPICDLISYGFSNEAENDLIEPPSYYLLEGIRRSLPEAISSRERVLKLLEKKKYESLLIPSENFGYTTWGYVLSKEKLKNWEISPCFEFLHPPINCKSKDCSCCLRFLTWLEVNCKKKWRGENC